MISSVGLEHLVYTEGVGGSSPSSPTTKMWGRSSVWLERRPVKPEAASSSLVAPATQEEEEKWQFLRKKRQKVAEGCDARMMHSTFLLTTWSVANAVV